MNELYFLLELRKYLSKVPFQNIQEVQEFQVIWNTLNARIDELEKKACAPEKASEFKEAMKPKEVTENA